ncbi:hypothetical protein CAPTEDRAFT_190474 [Capitella teleta]|uniref:Uncharacterized protein n=1 Tax=Capitella teleta TaxID=283909 RepID=R7VDG4_CAPTE|nr:hypothetical protein CAPTEDRAFT_190474 [Capitella teleta]|eukprot:ELU14351.1 hypothetical protein CAPTEDRAFT_190474 [Capitella teleta]
MCCRSEVGMDTQVLHVPNRATAFHILRAAWLRRCRLTRLLLERDADVNSRNSDGETALMLALVSTHDDDQTSDRIKYLQLLLQHGADPNLQEVRHGNTALMLACRSVAAWAPRAIILLLSFGANPSTCNRHGHLPIQMAALAGHGEIALNKLLKGTKQLCHESAVDVLHKIVRSNCIDISQRQTNLSSKNYTRKENILSRKMSLRNMTLDLNPEDKLRRTLVKRHTCESLVSISCEEPTKPSSDEISLKEMTAVLVRLEKGLVSTNDQRPSTEVSHEDKASDSSKALPSLPTIPQPVLQTRSKGDSRRGSEGQMLQDEISETRRPMFPSLNNKKRIPGIVQEETKRHGSHDDIHKYSPETQKKRAHFCQRSSTVDLGDAVFGSINRKQTRF